MAAHADELAPAQVALDRAAVCGLGGVVLAEVVVGDREVERHRDAELAEHVVGRVAADLERGGFPDEGITGSEIRVLGYRGMKEFELGFDGFVPATPHAVIEMLHRSGVEIEGREAVVVGRSPVIGMPVAFMLVKENATVTVCHSRTKNLPEITRQADILIVAAGRPRT